jgi:O-antigen ligase
MNLSLALLTASVLISSIVDFATRLRGGPVSLQALWTIALGVGSLVFVVLRAKLPKAIVGQGIGLILFLLLGTLTLLVNPGKLSYSLQAGFQSLLVYGGFVGLLLLSAIETYQMGELPWYLNTGFSRSCQIATGIYGLSILVAGSGNNEVLGARSFALFALVAISWFAASGRYTKPAFTIWAILATVAVAFSLSRTATVLSLLTFPLAQISPRDTKTWLRSAAWAGLVVLIAQLAFIYITPIRERFTEKGDQGQLAGFKISTSGRDYLWEKVGNSIAAAPPLAQVIGLGAGSTNVAVSGGQPHNDYLRLQHDFGYVGLSLWLFSYAWLIVATIRAWSWADQFDPQSAHVPLAAFMSLLTVGLAMITDNVIVYIFVMSPMAILTGSAIGLHAIRRKLRRAYFAAPSSEAVALTDRLPQTALTLPRELG